MSPFSMRHMFVEAVLNGTIEIHREFKRITASGLATLMTAQPKLEQ
jgi:hypothetical protein